MNRCLQRAHVLKRMTKGKITLIRKDPLHRKRAVSNNYRPITCLRMVWNILTTRIREEIYFLLTSRGFFPEEQKGCCKRSSGTGEQLKIYQKILNESKTRQKNLAMTWIDHRKAYDMVPQSWIINYLKKYKISDEVINFIGKAIENR